MADEIVAHFEVVGTYDDYVVVEINGRELVLTVGETITIVLEGEDDDNIGFRDSCH